MSPRLPHATIFADASYCHITKAAGWGGWMVSRSRPSMTYGGPIRGQVHGAKQAELLAMANALHIASRAGFLAKGAEIMLQSDCTQMLGLLRTQFNASDRPMKDATDGVPVPRSIIRCWGKRGKAASSPEMDEQRRGLLAMKGIVDEWQLNLIVRHVRGHRNKAASEGDGRAWVNKEVDRIARLGMIRARLDMKGLGANAGTG